MFLLLQDIRNCSICIVSSVISPAPDSRCFASVPVCTQSILISASAPASLRANPVSLVVHLFLKSPHHIHIRVSLRMFVSSNVSSFSKPSFSLVFSSNDKYIWTVTAFPECQVRLFPVRLFLSSLFVVGILFLRNALLRRLPTFHITYRFLWTVTWSTLPCQYLIVEFKNARDGTVSWIFYMICVVWISQVLGKWLLLRQEMIHWYEFLPELPFDWVWLK